MKNVQVLVKKVLDLMEEVNIYTKYKNLLKVETRKLFLQYQAGKYNYFTYEKKLRKVLKGRTEDEMIQYYNSYILYLLKRIESLNSEIFYEAYHDTRHKKLLLKAPEPPKELPKKAAEKEKAPVLVEMEPNVIEKAKGAIQKKAVKAQVKEEIMDLKGLKAGKAGKTAKRPEHIKLHKRTFWDWFVGKPKGALEEIAEEKSKNVKMSKEEGAVAVGGTFGFGWFKNLFSRSQNVHYGKKSEVGTSTLQIEHLRRSAQPEIKAQIEKITATSLTREAKRIREIMERRKSLKIYHPSFFASLANVTIKKISLFLLDTFPDFFKDLYHALRLANIKILSNTYVNMMVLGVIVSFFIGLVFFAFTFLSTPMPLDQALLRIFGMSFLMSVIAFAGFYGYPYSMMKQRRRSINTNLPFAINHMAAVSASGVSPTKMFKLISESKEYGEISHEIEKIVNYIEIFGYDVLTSIKAVSATTPSYQFKDFFEGMISTTQTGGDISAFLSQKADEAMLNYKLERKKYTETISTYSDIYTGILIAAPLFFVAALSLVSLLGGKIGGIDVNVIIVLGTYVVIPVLNIGFLTFLELTQPEV